MLPCRATDTNSYDMTKILVADDLGEEGMAMLRDSGDVTLKTGMKEDALRAELPGYEVLVVRSATTVTARSLELADSLAVVGRAGIGVDNIDVDACTARGIAVMNTPEANAVTTAEHAVALLMSLARNIPAADASIRAGHWSKSKFTGAELQDKQLGVVGLGRIGGIAAEKCRGLGMTVAAYDPFVTQAKAPDGVRMLDLDELLATSDFVTVHVPLLDETRHLLNRERLLNMKRGARLVHAARGGIVCERGLVEALTTGHLAGAALDVFEAEPLSEDSPLRTAPNLVLTPHLGASTDEAKRNVSRDMARQIDLVVKRGVVLNGVNVARISPADAAQVGPYMDLARNLAAVLTQTFDGPVQSVRLTVQGGIPTSAHRALTVATLAGALQPSSSGPVTPVNAERIAQERDVRAHCDASTMKRDFMSLLRVEVVIDGERHSAAGTVLGHKHGRMVQLDDYVLDAIPEGPMIITFHRDEPGVVGQIGTVIGSAGCNISRMQIGQDKHTATALGILNLDGEVDDSLLDAVRAIAAVENARLVR
ncbi:MAG: phosphoglycerate dehydrogenase [Planctomycetes bacterium]|nr:phosphoglycerate dehydrogenase [Planctomycetota bacterium]